MKMTMHAITNCIEVCEVLVHDNPTNVDVCWDSLADNHNYNRGELVLVQNGKGKVRVAMIHEENCHTQNFTVKLNPFPIPVKNEHESLQIKKEDIVGTCKSVDFVNVIDKYGNQITVKLIPENNNTPYDIGDHVLIQENDGKLSVRIIQIKSDVGLYFYAGRSLHSADTIMVSREQIIGRCVDPYKNTGLYSQVKMIFSKLFQRTGNA